MQDRAGTQLLSRLASVLTQAPADQALRDALSIAREAGVVPLEPGADTAWRTLTAGSRKLALARAGESALDAAEIELLCTLLQLALTRLSEDEELRRVRERMTLLSEASFEGLFFHVDGRIIDANTRLSEITGYDSSEVIGDTLFARCIAPEDLPAVSERMATRYEGTYVITAVRKDGSRFRAELQAKQGKLGDRPVRIAAVRDVTERERMEALLRESETRLRQLAEKAFDVIVFSRDGVILDISGLVERIHGRKPEEMIGHKILEFVRGPSAERIERVLANHLTGAYEATAIRKDGSEIPLEIVAVLTTLRGEPVRMAALRDMRETHRLAEERRTLELAFERSQRLESLGVLAGGIAHDFNNLLTVILGNAEILKADLEEPALRSLAEAIVDTSQRAASLTAQMLAYAGRRELGPRSSVDLGALLSELQTLLAAALSKRAKISLAIEPDTRVLGNRATLTQVLMNLLTNASDALGEESGTIGIRTRRVTQPDARWAASLGAKITPGDWVLIEVSDTGSGMDAATKARVFEPFFSTKAKGHGLGLAACIGIVSSHGGAILVESERGRGSVFSVLLPAATARSEPSVDVDSVRALAIKKVLIVDDEAMVRMHLRHAFQSQGYEVEEASGGEAALQAAIESAPSLIVLDMTMPDLSGIEVLQRLRARGLDVPVILTSGYHDARLDAQGYQAFLAKPYTLSELLHAVKLALNAS